MTGPDDHPEAAAAQILIDQWDDGHVEDRAWVEVTTTTDTPDKAVAHLETVYPEEHLPDGARYACTFHVSGDYEEGENEHGQVWQRPRGRQLPDEPGTRVVTYEDDSEDVYYYDQHWPWERCKEGDPEAKLFWVISVDIPPR